VILRGVVREVGAYKAKLTFSALLDAVERGDEITITRRGKPVARLVPPGRKFDPAAPKAAAARIRKRRKGVTLDGLAVKDLVNYGRP
jgi:prevent-host-death family protein